VFSSQFREIQFRNTTYQLTGSRRYSVIRIVGVVYALGAWQDPGHDIYYYEQINKNIGFNFHDNL